MQTRWNPNFAFPGRAAVLQPKRVKGWSPRPPNSSTGVGYHGTDSNRIAREAGYSPGVFYKHFADKREIFLEAYQTWVVSEWKAVEGELSSGGTTHATARRLVR